MPYTHVDPEKFRCSVYPATQRQQLEYLWNCQTMDANPTDLMSNLDVIKSVELNVRKAKVAPIMKSKNNMTKTSKILTSSQLPRRRLVNEYGGSYRKHHGNRAA